MRFQQAKRVDRRQPAALQIAAEFIFRVPNNATALIFYFSAPHDDVLASLSSKMVSKMSSIPDSSN